MMPGAINMGIFAALGSAVTSLNNYGFKLRLRTGELKVRKCNPSQHNTLRYDQVERRRKIQRKGR